MKIKTNFYKEFYRINLPIFISQLFLVSVGIFNSLIFGQLGEKVLTVIAITDKINGIYWPIIAAIATIMTIYFIQYNGSNDKEGIKNIFILSTFLMIGMSLVVFILTIVFGKRIIALYTNEEFIIREAYFYLWSISISNIIATCTYSLITYFNGVGKVKETSKIAMIQITLNFFLYYIFILKTKSFLNGIKGIIIAIIITKVFEFILYLRIYIKSFSLKNYKFNYKKIKNLKGINRKITPLIINNLIFMISSNIIFIGFSQMGVNQAAAVGIADGLIGNFNLLLIGFITSSKLMLGTLLGKNKLKTAYIYSTKLIKIMILIGIISTLSINLLARIYLKFYKINDYTMDLSYKLIFIASLFFILKMLNNLIVDGILRIGGDITSALINDLIGILIFGVGFSLFFTKVIVIDIKYLYFIICSNEVIRFYLNYNRYKKKIWLNNTLKN